MDNGDKWCLAFFMVIVGVAAIAMVSIIMFAFCCLLYFHTAATLAGVAALASVTAIVRTFIK